MLRVRHINTFIGRKKIIKDVSFQVNPGSIVGLIGPNGAGKTTIMKTILGLTKFTGNISVEDKNVTENNHAALTRVGALIEHPAIYPFLTGLENLKLYSLDEADMNNIVSMLKMDTYINTKSKGYSMGMKQKLGIAIALLNKPQLVILDEPMNGLDIEATILIRQIIKQYAAQGSAFLISSHVLGELQKVMTNVLLITEGKIIVDEPIDEFNRVSRQQYHLLTEDMPATEKLFAENQIPVTKSDDYLVIPHELSYQVQDLLYSHHIRLVELSPQGLSFEQTVVSLLQQQRRQNHEK
ncbi:ATP-binding cassette domain-containing protein [Lentilactobacillus sp. IMAU92037]|uniref:ABC transporter ATP-binding protein n=1 Tax=Lentilactobacillus dabitei TaxID=2831523 RepID=UPI001C27B1B0|nr:ATP-binding cassette domain-containing protein [Lentilactobacillus dabitei]MBU9788150.1 ATP-binding cassette domain-containing protein [Lentilactobacillus dabitei]MBV0929523.1 ATP-binding cassette domain-containing protein [Lentilactobacillus dabitei]